MKKTIIYFFILCLLFSCTSSKNEKFDSKEYNALISKAENELLNKNSFEAHKLYKKAFKKFPKMFSSDFNNALVTSIKNKYWDDAIIYSSELIKKGCDFSFFERDFFEEFKSVPQWNVLEEKYDELRYSHFNNIDKVLIDSLNILNDIDQNQYCLIPSGKIELKNAFSRTVFIDSLLSKLIDDRGFPSEELIGANVKGDTYISPLPSYFSLLRHSYQANSDLLQKRLQKAIVNGYLKEEVYNKISAIDNMRYIVIDCKIYKDKFNNSDSLKDILFEKKIIYNNSIMDEGYILYAPLAILNETTKEDFGGGHFDAMYEYIADYSDCNK